MSDSKISALIANGLQPLASIANTYLPPFTGGIVTSISAKLSESVSVLDFGADPSGVNDSAAAIQTALTAVAASGGGAVLLPPCGTGFYRCSSGITVPVGVTLMCFSFCPSNPYSSSGITGPRLVFDLSVVNCVTVGGSSANNG